MTTESAEHQHGPREAPGGGDTAAALRAAVRAVESGEADAAEFFTRPVTPAPPPVPAGPPPAGAAPATVGAGGRPVAVPEELATLLATGGVPDALGAPLAAALGETAATALRADPWALLRAPGVRPEQADGFARALAAAGVSDIGPDDARRGTSLVVWALETAARHGDTAREAEALCRELAGHAVPEPRRAVEDAADSGAVLLVEEPVPGATPDAEGQVATRIMATLEQHAAAEEALAEGLVRLRSTFAGGAPEAPGVPDASGPSDAPGVPDASSDTDDGAGPEGAAARWRSAAERAATPAAAELVRAVADSPVVLHTATAAVCSEPAALLAAAREVGLRAACVVHAAGAHAAGVPAWATDQEARTEGASARPGAAEGATTVGADEVAGTVADLLAGATHLPREAGGALALDLLVVFDAEQLTTEAAATLTELLPDGARLVFSGDPALLGPAGAGRPFTELLATGSLPRVASRTPLPGPLGELVSSVAAGELARVEAPDREVVIVPVSEPGEALHRTVQLVTDSIPRAFGHRGTDLVVLTATHGGPVGARSVNAALKDRLSPGPGRFGGFDPGDRVAWSPSPGRTVLGTVAGQSEDGGLRLEPDGSDDVLVVPAGHGSLRHAWAVTVHQAAGHSWPAAVVVVPGDAGGVLDRAWAYTAFSRARRHLSVVQGAGPALARAVSAPPAPPTTRFASVLRQTVADAEG